MSLRIPQELYEAMVVDADERGDASLSVWARRAFLKALPKNSRPEVAQLRKWERQ